MVPLKVALVHNLKPTSRSEELPPDYYSECDSPKTVKAIAEAIRKAGHTVYPVEADRELPQWLKANPVDLAFNIAEGFQGEAREARVPALLELLEIPYTGSGVLTLALALDKAKSKQIFRYAGIPTPHFQLFTHLEEPLESRLHYPLIVKPNREGSAKGIWASSVVQDEAGLKAQVRKVFELYRQEVLVEEYIDGKELTVGILGIDVVLPILEIDFSPCTESGEFFYSWRMKEFQGNKELNLNPRFLCPASLEPEDARAVKIVALKAARALGCRDFARVDIRLSSEGIPYVLEVNPLPGLDPEESNLPFMAKAAGISYEALIARILNLAIERSALSSIPLSTPKVPTAAVPRGGALPDSGGETAFRAPGDPAVALERQAPRKNTPGTPKPRPSKLGPLESVPLERPSPRKARVDNSKGRWATNKEPTLSDTDEM